LLKRFDKKDEGGIIKEPNHACAFALCVFFGRKKENFEVF
jgi:hypothetical protein